MCPKNLLLLFIAPAVLVGCKASNSNPAESHNDIPENLVPNSPSFPTNNGVPTNTGKQPTTDPKEAPAVPNPDSHKTTLNPGSRYIPPQPTGPSVPAENPQAAPPKPGEQVASNFKIQLPNQSIEVEGVCKLTEEEAFCWKPSGEDNPDLAKELTSAVQAQSNSNSYGSNFQFKFMKKNRILILKTVTTPQKPGSPGNSFSAGLMNTYSSNGEFAEGWTNNYSIFNGSNSTGFDQTRTERQVLSGAFNKSTKTFPLRYQVTNYNPSQRTSVPVKKGTIELGGNVYEIESISDKPTNPGYMPPNYGPNAVKAKYTYFSIKAIKINDPYAVVTLSPADASGEAYGGLDKDGNPLTMAEANKRREEEQKKMMDAARAGKGYSSSMTYTNSYIQPITLDPSYMTSGSKMVRMMMMNVEPSKIKNFAVGIQHRTVFVFDKVKLDKN